MFPPSLLDPLEKQFDGLLACLKRLLDIEGARGFFYALSSRREARFQPDIESTAFAIEILDGPGVLTHSIMRSQASSSRRFPAPPRGVLTSLPIA